MASDPMEVEVFVKPERCPKCHNLLPAESVAILQPGTLSAAIQRLGWAAVEFDEADTAWTKAAHKPSGPHDQLKAAEERYDASLEAVNAALAEVRRLHPTPPEGTNG